MPALTSFFSLWYRFCKFRLLAEIRWCQVAPAQVYNGCYTCTMQNQQTTGISLIALEQTSIGRAQWLPIVGWFYRGAPGLILSQSACTMQFSNMWQCTRKPVTCRSLLRKWGFSWHVNNRINADNQNCMPSNGFYLINSIFARNQTKTSSL